VEEKKRRYTEFQKSKTSGINKESSNHFLQTAGEKNSEKTGKRAVEKASIPKKRAGNAMRRKHLANGSDGTMKSGAVKLLKTTTHLTWWEQAVTPGAGDVAVRNPEHQKETTS